MTDQQKPPLIWLNIFIFSTSLLLALVVLPIYGFFFGFGSEHWIWLAITFCFCNLTITTGYHRLWSHKAFEAHAVIRIICAIGGAFSLQNSVLHWASDHRNHHKYVDNNHKDPYSAKKGFWYSHVGWMLREYDVERYSDYTNCRDLKKDRIVMWQHNNYVLLALLTNIAIPVGLGLLYGDVLGMLLVVGALRLVLNHHTTFFINSLAHIWGSQPYTDKNSARDSAFLAFLTFGEGYHNYHHIFENDYRNGIDWWQYDPTKWVIRLSAWLGLASNLKRSPEERIEKAKAKMQLIRANNSLELLPDCQTMIKNLHDEYGIFLQNMNAYYEVKKQLIEMKKNKIAKKYDLIERKKQYQEMKLRWLEQRKSWNQLALQYA